MQLKPLNGAIQNALNGINRGVAGLANSAAKTASAHQLAGGSPTDLAVPLVEAAVYRLQVEASAKMLSRVEEALGSLLDERS